MRLRLIDLFPDALDREEDLLFEEFEEDPGCNCPECIGETDEGSLYRGSAPRR